LLGEVYEQCQRARAEGIPINFVKRLYEEFEYEQVSDKIADIVRPEGMKAELQVVYQTVENLHKAIPNHSGDWYFTGNFPTPGGMKVANKSYMNYMDGKLVRAY
jgi:amidophosphoribosyltransferase